MAAVVITRAWEVAQRWAVHAVRVGRESVDEFRRADGVRHAAAISYFALLSFLPFLVMTLSALGFVLAALGRGYGSQEEFIHAILDATREAIPFWHEDLAARVRELMGAREAMGIVGAVALILTSSLVFSALESALNRIFDVTRNRHMVKSKLIFVGFVATLGVFTVIAHYVVVFIDSFIAAAGGKPLYEYVYATALSGKLLAYAGTVLAFVALIKYFCRRRIRLAHLWIGATLFFILFEAAKYLFSLYLEYVAQFSALYGSLSTVMVLVIWTFYTVAIFLLCTSVVKRLYEDDPRRRPLDQVPGVESDWLVTPGS
jgi:membrane protein